MSARVNVPILLASLLFSVLLWLIVYVQNAPPMSPRPVGMRLLLDGLDTNRLVAVNPPDRFRTTVTAPEEQYRALVNNENLEAVVDLREAQPGRQAYRVQIFPEQFRGLFEDAPLEVRIPIEPRSERNFKVMWDTRGELSDRTLRLQDVVVDPARVAISGPKSMVDRVAAVRAVLDLGALDPDVRKPQQVGVEVVDASGRPVTDLRLDPVYVNLTPILNPAPQQKLAFVFPNIRGVPAIGYGTDGYEIEPNQVTLSGRSAALAALNQVLTQAIDISGIKASRTYLVGLILPKGVQWATGRQVRVRVIVRPVPKIESPPPPKASPPKTPASASGGGA